MAVIAAQTRKQLRQSVGYRTGAMVTGTTTSAGSSGGTSFTDTELVDADDWANGKHWVGTSGTNDGVIRIVDDYVGGSKTGTFRTAATGQVASAVTYELWDADLPPARIHNFINDAIRSITRKGAPPTTDVSLHSSYFLTNYTIPSSVVGIQRVFFRFSVTGEVLLNCDSVFDELVDADVTASLDSEVRMEGSGSNKFVLAAGLGAGDIIASDSISSADLSKYTHVEFWIRSTVAATAGDLQLILSSTANGATAVETVSVPALTADTWTWCRVAMATPESCTAVISVALKHTVDIGAATVWVDRIECTQAGTEVWKPVHGNFWTVDRANRQIIFDRDVITTIGHSLLKLVGFKKPTVLSADTDSCDVEPEYIIAKASALAYRARADRNASQREAANTEADRLDLIAERALMRQQTPSGTKWVD